MSLFTCIAKTIHYDTKSTKRRKVIYTTYSNKIKSPSGIIIIIAVLIAVYLIFASTTSVQAGPTTAYLQLNPCEKCSDLDNNGITNMSDLEEFVANWLWAESVEQPDNAADLNCDEKVNFTDFAILAENWLRYSAITMNLIIPLEMILTTQTATSSPFSIPGVSYISLDSDDYDGATYDFEIIATNTSSTTDYTVDLYDVTGSAAKASITVPKNTNTATRFRAGANSWSPTDNAKRTYAIRLSQTAEPYTFLIVDTARIIITQINATKTRIQIPLVDSLEYDVTCSTTYTQVHPTKYNIYLKDTSVFADISGWNLEVIIGATIDGGTTYCALFDKTDNDQVGNTEMSVSGSKDTLLDVDFTNTETNFDDGHEFEMRIKSSGAPQREKIVKANLYVELTNLSKAEVFWLTNHYATASKEGTSYPKQRVLLDTSAYSGATIYFESVAACADNATVMYLRDHLTNDSGTDGSDVSDSGLNFNSATKVRVRSSSLSITDDDRFYTRTTDTANNPIISNSWIIIDCSGTSSSSSSSSSSSLSSSSSSSESNSSYSSSSR